MTEPGQPAAPAPISAEHPAFAHASEAELARILDFYDVRWSYEPDTFPIGWNLDGEVVESFSPDFYLPDLDMYVELTTLKQKLVRKKNRKLRRLRELYPDVRIKLFYARDFRALLLKFGRMALVDELTGTGGQATPPRAGSPDAEPAIPVAATAAPGGAPRDFLVDDRREIDDVPVPVTPPAEQRGRRRGRRRRHPAREPIARAVATADGDVSDPGGS